MQEGQTYTPVVIYGHAYRDVGGRAASGTSGRESPVCGERAWMPVAAQRRLACMDAGGRAASGTKAEESRRAESGCETDCNFPWSAGVTRLSFPLCGNGLYQALDSGLRRNDGAFGSLPYLLFFCCLSLPPRRTCRFAISLNGRNIARMRCRGRCHDG